MIDKLKSITVIFALTIMLCSLAYGATPINKTAAVLHSTAPAANTEQYELTINADDKVTETHVELLPDDNGKYWIPKGYKVKVTGDCEDGYIQNTGTDTYILDEAKTVNVGTEVAPPTEADLLRDEIESLQNQITELSEINIEQIYYSGTIGGRTTEYITVPKNYKYVFAIAYALVTYPDNYMAAADITYTQGTLVTRYYHDVMQTSNGSGTTGYVASDTILLKDVPAGAQINVFHHWRTKILILGVK